MLLYGASLLAIIPLSRLLATKYQIKVELAQTLSTKVKLGDTILEGLDELVVVTDSEFNIISVNGAVERRLLASKSEILRRPLFDVLFLRDQNGIQLNYQYMQSSNLFTQQSLNLENIFLYSKNSAYPKKVLVRVKPTLSVEGRVDQITFIIRDADHPAQESTEKIDLESINMREQAVIEDLKSKLSAKGLLPERGMVELLSRMSQDFATINQLTHHLYEVKPGLIDIAQITERSVVVSTDFAQSLKVKLTYELKQQNQDKVNQLVPQGFNISAKDLTSPYFTSSVDIKWFDYLLQKLIDLSILLSSEKSGGVVQVSVTEYSKTELLLIFQTSFTSLTEDLKNDLFIPFYGNIPLTTLKLGSGVEGYLVKKLSEIMKLDLTVEILEEGLRFKLMINRLIPLTSS
jgi:hypothetical protein